MITTSSSVHAFSIVTTTTNVGRRQQQNYLRDYRHRHRHPFMTNNDNTDGGKDDDSSSLSSFVNDRNRRGIVAIAVAGGGGAMSSGGILSVMMMINNHNSNNNNKAVAATMGSFCDVRSSSSLSSSSTNLAASAASTTSGGNNNGLLAELPMVRLKLPKGGFGREYVAIKLYVQGQGPFDFMIDSGLTTELITPHLQNILHIQDDGKTRLSALAAGGSTASNALVELNGVSLCCGNFPKNGDNGNSNNGEGQLPLPPLNAVITDFPQEHIDPSHDPVEGMLGMELLQMFDVDFDFPNNQLRFWKPGTADTTGLIEIPAVVINESLLIGIRITSADNKRSDKQRQPILGFLDCGSTFSCLNWKAAELLGLPPKNDPSYKQNPAVAALGVDGRPLTLPTATKQLEFAGNVIVDPTTGRPTGFESPPSNWKPWDPVQVAIGDIPVFSEILGDGRTPYDGPAALIGLDILSQRRVILEAGNGRTRARKVAVSPR